ncbi:MAG: DNA processing protein DprA, partial [Alkalinema sp. RU_4_3]|nr:DNA processing protein DprA [Alkalinema sp. RU_4_3]
KALACPRTHPTSLDRLLETTQLPIAIASSGLLELELLGLITQTPGMHYTAP